MSVRVQCSLASASASATRGKQRIVRLVRAWLAPTPLQLFSFHFLWQRRVTSMKLPRLAGVDGAHSRWKDHSLLIAHLDILQRHWKQRERFGLWTDTMWWYFHRKLGGEKRTKTFEVDMDDGFHYSLNLIPSMIISILSLPSSPEPQTTRSPTHPSPSKVKLPRDQNLETAVTEEQ